MELSEGVVRVYPVWDCHNDIYTLTIESYDIYLEPEILILTKDDIEDIDIQEAVFESIKQKLWR